MTDKTPFAGVNLIRGLVTSGKRIFSTKEARACARELGISENYVVELLHHLRKGHWIQSVKRGVYAITPDSGFEDPPHDYEIATHLATPSTISHWSALYHHGLTQQIPQTIFVTVPTGTSIPKSAQEKNRYHFVQLKHEAFFGSEQTWIGNAQVWITDPERTLLDGLLMPKYCGGIHEVIGAFKMRGSELDLDRIIEYGCRLGGAVPARLGWVLEREGYPVTEQLRQCTPKGVRNLDASGPNRGPINRRWHIRENIGVSER